MMFETVGALSGLVPDDIVVVGKLPLKAKAGKARLTKIRDENLSRAEKARRRALGEKPAVASRAPAPALGEKPAAFSFLELPADVQLHVLHAAGPTATGQAAATGKQAAKAFWQSGPWAFWSGGHCTTWDDFRRWRFGLDAGWLERLRLLQRTGDAHEVLTRAGSALRGVLQPAEAHAAAEVLIAASCRCNPSDALALFDKVVGAFERTKRFPKVQRNLNAARGDLLEREIFEGLDQAAQEEHERLAFDYFADLEEPGDFWDELEALEPHKEGPADEWPEPDAAPAPAPDRAGQQDRALAAEFVEALGLYHRHDWATTEAAMYAVQQ